MEWIAYVVTFVFGLFVGAGLTSILYERNLLRVSRREGTTRSISQLDVFELPGKSNPPKKGKP